MQSTNVLKLTLIVLALLPLAIATPVQSATKDDGKTLQEEVDALKAENEQMRKDMADIKDQLAKGARAGPPPAPPFEPADLVVGESPYLGSSEASVTIFAYSDYQCPFCARYANDVLPQITKDYVDSGKVRVVMREYPIEAIHAQAFAASQAALCAGEQGRYWEMHDLIFVDQKALSSDDLNSHSQSLGLNASDFDACMADEEIEKRIRDEIAEAHSLGISGTPSFVVGLTDPQDANKVRVTKSIIGAQSFTTFQQAFDGLAEEAADIE